MVVIEPTREDVDHPGHVKKYSSTLRLWHWLNAIVITGSLLTVLLNSTLLDTRPNASFIQSELKNAGAVVTNRQARSAAHAISDKIWAIHIYCGYTLAGLLLFRLILELFQLADQKLIRKIKSAYTNYVIIRKNRELSKHEFWVKTIYAMFYLMLFTMVLTGFCLVFEDDVPLLHSIHAFREIHSFTMYLILGFIIIHLEGVFLAERKDSRGIVSDMINGGKE
jgi:Ni/Fe-hydrogenase 1 B-type cytochrome subunit